MTLKELEKAITGLSPEELAEFREWFHRFDMDEWDRQIARDAEAGRLDHLIEEARRNIEEGNLRRLCPKLP
jgi:hypothetical protein